MTTIELKYNGLTNASTRKKPAGSRVLLAQHPRPSRFSGHDRRCPTRAKSDGEPDSFPIWGIAAPAMDSGSSWRMMGSRAFLKLVLKHGLWFQLVDEGRSNGCRDSGAFLRFVFEKILGGAFDGWNIFRGGRFGESTKNEKN